MKPGDLFVAIRGGNFRRAEFRRRSRRSRLCRRVQRSADRRLSHSHRLGRQRPGGSRLALPTFGGQSQPVMKLIGVTGTNGKTTTACLIAGMLSHAGLQDRVCSARWAISTATTSKTPRTPRRRRRNSPRLLARMVDNGCSHAVMEVSSHALDQSRVAGVSLRRRLRDERHPRSSRLPSDDPRLSPCEAKALRASRAPKASRWSMPTIRSPAGFLRRFDGPALTIGIEKAAEIMGTPIEQCRQRADVPAHGGQRNAAGAHADDRHAPHLQLPDGRRGRADLRHRLAAVVRWLEAAAHVPGRLGADRMRAAVQRVRRFRPHARRLEKCLQTLRAVTAGRLICVFGAGGERDRAKRPLMGRIAEQHADLADRHQRQSAAAKTRWRF